MSLEVEIARNDVAEEKVLKTILRAYEDRTESATTTTSSATSPRNGAYSRTTLEKTSQSEIAEFHFAKGTATTLHGHAEAAVLIKAYSGLLIEESFIPQKGCSTPKAASTCSCRSRADGYACSYEFQIRQIRAGESVYLPIGAFHRIHCFEASYTRNVYTPLSSNPVAPVPREISIKLYSSRCQSLERFRSMLQTPLFDANGPKSIARIIHCCASAWAEREKLQNETGAIKIHPDTIADFRSTGILASPIPLEYGGLGDSIATVCKSIRELAASAPATALALAMPLGNAAAATIPLSAVPDSQATAMQQNTEWLVRKIVDERQIIAVANSEPGGGGEIALTKTQAEWDGDHYELTGRKSFATIGADADYFMCAARNGETVDGFFIAKSDLQLDSAWNPLGMRPTASVGITLERSRAAALLSFSGSLSGVNARHWSTLMFASVFIGGAVGALALLQRSLDAKTRANAHVRATVGGLMLRLDAGLAFVEALTSSNTIPPPAGYRRRCNNAKTYAAQLMVDAALQASMLSGGRAYKADNPAAQLLRDALAAPLLRPPLPKVMDELAAAALDAADAEILL